MGLLDKLWDDTVAGPRPETGLSRLRKHPSFPFRPSAVKGERSDAEGAPRVTRSIMIKRPEGCPPPESPGESTTPPSSPFSGKESNRFRRKSMSDAYERGAGVGVGGTAGVGSRSPTLPHEV